MNLTEPSAATLGRAIDGVAWALRVSEGRGGPAADRHLEELRLHMLRARRQPWRPARRAEVDLAVAVVRSHLEGTDAVLPLRDTRVARRLLVDLLQMERAVRTALPAPVAA